MNNKKIFFLIASLEFGGAERVLSEIAGYLAMNRYCVTVLTLFKGEKEYTLNELVRRVNLDIPKKGIKKLTSGRKKLFQFLKDEKVELCISFDILANILLVLSHPRQCKAIISERNAPRQTQLSTFSKVLRAITYNKANGCVFQTEEAKLCYSKKLQKKSWIIPNPVRSDLPYRSESKIRNEIIAIGRLEEQKNYVAMINGFTEFSHNHDDYVLKIFGSGSLRKVLEERAKENGIQEKIVFKGSSANVHSQIVHSKIFLMTSNYEGIPNALMEAMAMGFPVVAHDCPSGGVKMLINHGINGLLIQDQNPDTINHALCQIADDDSLSKKLGENAKLIREEYALSKIGKYWIEFIQSYNKGDS